MLLNVTEIRMFREKTKTNDDEEEDKNTEQRTPDYKIKIKGTKKSEKIPCFDKRKQAIHLTYHTGTNLQSWGCGKIQLWTTILH